MLAFGFRRGGDISTPYVQSFRLIVKNAVLWVMFLASMGASVFFSFDSHFNAIFPADARKRAAEIRTTSQIGGVVADIGALTQKRQIEEAERLFDTEGWKAYDKQLASLGQAAQGAQAEIEKYFVQKMEERRRAIAQQQERIATAQSGQAGLAGKKVSLTEELSRLKAERPGLAAEYGQHQSELDAKAKEIDGKRVEGMAEDRGVEGTLKQGKGPVYRQRQAELGTLQDQYKIKQERTKDAQKRLIAVEIAHRPDRARALHHRRRPRQAARARPSPPSSASRRPKAVNADDEGVKLDPARVLPAFERARAAFRQQPDTERLGALQAQCTHLINAMASTQATKERVRAIDCDPKQAAEAAARVFALNAGLAAFQANCAGGDKLAKLTTTDSLLGFGRKCLQDSGLISKDSAEIGARLSGIDMNRDDKAHRFVVTWNAFLDGNRLAYLALTLAIGVDLAGVHVGPVRRPGAALAALRRAEPEGEERASARGHHRGGAAARHLQECAPGAGGHASKAAGGRLHQRGQALRARSRKRRAGARCAQCRRHHRRGAGSGRARPLSRALRAAHLPVRHRQARAQAQARGDGARARPRPAREAHPRGADARGAWRPRTRCCSICIRSTRRAGSRPRSFSTRSIPQHLRPVRNLLTAGSSLRVVVRDKSDTARYYVHADLYTTLARIRARELAMLTRGGRPIDGGLLGQLPRRPDRRWQRRQSRPAIVGPTDDELRTSFQDALLAALGLHVAALHKVADPAIAGQAVSAAIALKRQAPAHHGLNEQLKLVDSENNRALEQAQRALANHYADDPRAIELLAETESEIRKLLPALVLLPEGGLFDRLVNALEDAQADMPLSSDEDVLLKRLRRLKEDLDSMDWSNEAAWDRVHRQIGHFNDISAPGLPAGDGTGPTKH